MIARRVSALLALAFFLSPATRSPALAQTQTTGRISGTVKDQNGGVITSARVVVVSRATGEGRKTTTDEGGNYSVSLLPPGIYQVSIGASGFKPALFDNVTVVITETTRINADLAVGSVIKESVSVRAGPKLIQTDGPRMGRVVDSRG